MLLFSPLWAFCHCFNDIWKHINQIPRMYVLLCVCVWVVCVFVLQPWGRNALRMSVRFKKKDFFFITMLVKTQKGDGETGRNWTNTDSQLFARTPCCWCVLWSALVGFPVCRDSLSGGFADRRNSGTDCFWGQFSDGPLRFPLVPLPHCLPACRTLPSILLMLSSPPPPPASTPNPTSGAGESNPERARTL